MNRVTLVCAIAGFLPSVVVAGDIFGTITEAEKPLPNAQVKVTIAGKTYAAATNAGGSYRVYVPESGKATLTVTVGSRVPSIEVFSSERATRYDLMIGPANELRRR